MNKIILQELVAQKIFFIRGYKVMLDKDLAELYGVPTKRLNEQMRRNMKRFPDDFAFQLTKDEFYALRSQFATLKRGQHSKYLPYAFTEQGVAMLSGVISSDRAIQVNIVIMRTFAKLREILFAHKELAHKLNELESKLEGHDKEIKTIFEVIHQLMRVSKKTKSRIGFLRERRAKYSAGSY